MEPLATVDDLTTYEYAATAGLFLARASTRVYGYLAGRMSAAGIFAAAPVLPDSLVECVCAIAFRMASTDPHVESGVRSEGSGAESVTFGAEAYAGVADLTSGEKSALDRLFPVSLRTAQL